MSRTFKTNCCCYMPKIMSSRLISLVLLILLVSTCSGKRNNDFGCDASKIGDRLLAEKSVAKSFRFLRRVSATISFDASPWTINCVHAVDQWSGGRGGYAQIVGGGLGQRHVTVKITSRIGRGFYFIVRIYGQ